MKVLVIYDSAGVDKVKAFEATGEAAKIAILCHGQYINSTSLKDDAAMNILFARYFYDAEGNEMPKDPEFVELKDPTKTNGPYDSIVICGFNP